MCFYDFSVFCLSVSLFVGLYIYLFIMYIVPIVHEK